jgi:hypothetical protein
MEQWLTSSDLISSQAVPDRRQNQANAVPTCQDIMGGRAYPTRAPHIRWTQENLDGPDTLGILDQIEHTVGPDSN